MLYMFSHNKKYKESESENSLLAVSALPILPLPNTGWLSNNVTHLWTDLHRDYCCWMISAHEVGGSCLNPSFYREGIGAPASVTYPKRRSTPSPWEPDHCYCLVPCWLTEPLERSRPSGRSHGNFSFCLFSRCLILVSKNSVAQSSQTVYNPGLGHCVPVLS